MNDSNTNNKINNENQKYNFSEFKLNLNKNNKQENEEMAIFDKNFNSENVIDLEAMKEKQNYYLGQNLESDKMNMNNSYYYSNNNKEGGHTHNQNSNKKNDKNFKLRNDIAKYFDKLSDNNMIELLVYIENIRPQSIKELANDTIYINMELFNDDTFSKVLNFVKEFN